jgi:hypothetical protein
MTKQARSAFLATILIVVTSALAKGSPTRDPQAMALANQALQALTGGTAITDASVQATANYIAGSDQETGTVTLEAHTGYESRIVLSLSGGERSEVRNGSGAPPQGKRSGSDGVWHAAALHNCWADPTWFFPALTIQSALNDPQVTLAYVGQETKQGIAVQHVRIARLLPAQSVAATALIQHLSQADMYLDATSYLPVAVAFDVHPDSDAGLDIPVEIQFAGWHAVSGIQAPSRIQKFIEGSLVLDLGVGTTLINTGIAQSDFTI